MLKQIDLGRYVQKIFWSLLAGALVGSVGGFSIVFYFVKNIWCYIGALVGGALGALQAARILASMLNLNEHQLYHGENITGQWIRLYWLLHSHFLLAMYGVVVGFVLSLGLMVYDTYNLPLLEGKATVIKTDIDEAASLKSDELKGRVYLITVQMGRVTLSYHVNRDVYFDTHENDIVQIAYTESRLFHIVQLRDVHKASP